MYATYADYCGEFKVQLAERKKQDETVHVVLDLTTFIMLKLRQSQSWSCTFLKMCATAA